MGYESWSEWCDSELGGFKLPAIERREVVAELAESGMSNRAISDVLDIDRKTVRRDMADQAGEKGPPEIIGQDGKTYQRPSTTGSPRM